MIVYNRSTEHDLLLARWWAILCETGELRTTFAKSIESLSSFYALFHPPSVLLFFTDANGIWLAAWFESVLSGAFMGLWSRQDKRKSRSAFRAVLSIYRQALVTWPVLIGVTKQEKLIDQHQRLGYTLLGKIPCLFDGEDAFVLVLTKQTFRDREV